MSDQTQQGNAPAAPAPGTPEHDAAMVAKADAAAAKAVVDAGGQPPADNQQQPPTEPQRPAWLPEKFKTPEDMAKSYAELEAKLGQPKPATPPADPKQIPADPPKADDTPAADDASKAVANAGLDMAKLSDEFATNGDLTPESYAALEKSGIPKPMVTAYIEGQKALAAQYDATAFAEAGGEAEYGQIVGWAKTALPAGEQAAFNAAVSSGNVDQMKLAVQGLKARFVAANGQMPNLLKGGNVSADGAYESMAQVTADMKKPEYKTDPAFRAKVERKLEASSFLSPFTRA